MDLIGYNRVFKDIFNERIEDQPLKTIIRNRNVLKSRFTYETVIFSLLLLIACTGDVFSQTWTGSVNSDWNTAGNWSGGSVPGTGATVSIPNTTNKPILNVAKSIGNLTIGNWGSATTLTIISGGALSVTGNFSMNGGGQLHIDGGSFNHTGTNYNGAYSATAFIEMTSGSFSSAANMNLVGGNNTSQPAFSAGSGTATFTGNLTVANSKMFYAENADSVYVLGSLTVNGSYYGDDGKTVVDGAATIGSGGKIYLDTGILKFNSTVNIGNNGTASFGSGTVYMNDDVTVVSSGYVNVENATVNITGNAAFSSNGNLSVSSGTINVGGNASIQSGGTMSLGGGNMNLEGDFSVTGGSSFQSDSSTVTFSGDGDQTISTGGNDITFYNVVVDSGATFQTDGDSENTIVIEGDLTVDEDGAVSIEEDDQLDVQGEVNGDGADNVTSPAPFAVSASATSSTSVVITFNKAMKETAAETISNYSIIRVSNPTSTLTVSSAVLNTGGDSKQVTLTVSTITDDVQYEITMNPGGSMQSTDDGALSTNHKKRFTKVGPITFYSITSGNWASNSTWSRTSHSGAAATSNPSTTSNATIIVGDGDVVTVASSTSITSQTSVSVTSGSKLTVGSGGTLTLGTKTITGAGTFEVTTGHIKIGSTTGITTSGATGNIQTTTRTYGSSGSYTYNGSSAQAAGNGLSGTVANLTIDNSAGVSISTNIEVSGTLSLTNGALTINSGYNLIANTKSISSGSLIMKRQITGSSGWRLLSSPIASTYSDLLDGIVTQGYSGAYYSTGSNPGDTLQPNVLYYDETYAGTDNQRWRAPSSASTSLTTGRGLFTYIFGDIDADPNYNDIKPFPVTLEVQGAENEGPIDFGVTYTTSADSGWNLVGNPYAATIDWDDSGNWTKTNIDGTLYVWDEDTEQFLTWNGSTGDLGNGLIAPFQGFWVKANGSSPSLIVDEEAKTTGGTFVGKVIPKQEEVIPMFSLTAVGEYGKVSTHFMFSEDALLGKDEKDGYRLEPFSGITNYLNLSSLDRNGEQFSINNMPRSFGLPIEIPIEIEAYEQGFSTDQNLYFEFNNLKNIPDGWTISLYDNEEGREINIQKQPTYIFKKSAVRGKIAGNTSGTAQAKLRSKVNPQNTRFSIIIDPGVDAADLPSEFTLSQNYPNPFNPQTAINVDLPLQGNIQLSIFDMLGRHIATLVDAEVTAGTHTYFWDASRYSSGVYIYRLITENGVFVKKMTLIK